MKVVIISDSHGNIANLKHFLGFAKKINAKAIIHCGDWDNLPAAKELTKAEVDLYTVRGNADIDPELIKELKTKSKMFNEKYLEVEIEGRKIGIIHNIKEFPTENQESEIVFCGHIHRQEEVIINGHKVVNPGSLRNEISFAVYDTKGDKVELIKI